MTVQGDRTEAERAAADLNSKVRVDLGDLRVSELVGRMIQEQTRDKDRGADRDRKVLHEIIEPAVGHLLAADLSGSDIERAFTAIYRARGTEETRAALGLIRDAYQWATRQGWCDDNPTNGITIRTLM